MLPHGNVSYFFFPLIWIESGHPEEKISPCCVLDFFHYSYTHAQNTHLQYPSILHHTHKNIVINLMMSCVISSPFLHGFNLTVIKWFSYIAGGLCGADFIRLAAYGSKVHCETFLINAVTLKKVVRFKQQKKPEFPKQIPTRRGSHPNELFSLFSACV